jgi:hypothetical protein
MTKKSKIATAILIDPFACQISQVEITRDDLETYYAALSHESMPVRTFEVARHEGLLAERDALFFDEEGLFKLCERGFLLRDARTPILGKGLVIGADQRGGTISAATDIERIRANTIFLEQTPRGMVRTDTPWTPPETVQ